MKRVRFLVLAAAAAAIVVLIAVVVTFSPSFQTYVARRVIASQPGLNVTVASVSAGLKRIEATQIRVEQAGAVLTVPSVEVDLPVLTAGFGQKALISRLVAKGWTLDFSKPGASQAEIATRAALPAVASAAVAQAFSGIFGQFQLPVDISIDGVELDGVVILPESRGRATVVVRGGGLGAGREGKFDLKANAALKDSGVNALRVEVALAAAMDTPRTLTRLVARLDAEATGENFPQGVKLAADLSAARAALGETYRVAIVGQDRQLLMLSAEFPAHARRLDGKWKLDVRDSDVAPFALGRPLPVFSVVGEGGFDTDAGFTGIHASGRVSAAVERLAALWPQLSAIGPVKLNADFDLTRRGEMISVERLSAGVSAAEPVATLETLQAFEFNPATGALNTADPGRDLLDVILKGLPLAWAAPFLRDISVSGGDLRGEVVATARAGGVSLRAKTPMTAAGVVVNRADERLLMGVDFSTGFSADYAPQGWQMEIMGLTARSNRGVLLAAEAKAGQLSGRDQPLKATGTISANLPAWLAQPVMKQMFVLTAGDAGIEFVASIAGKKEVQAKIGVKNLALEGKAGAEKLPAISAEVRADIAANGQVTLNTPILLEREGRKSDLTLAGTITPGKDARHLEAQMISSELFFDDASVLAAILPERGTPEATRPERDAAPPWAGLDGSLGLHLKKVIYGNLFQVTDIGGTLRLNDGALKIERLQAGLGEGGSATLSGEVTFNRAVAQPYGLDAALTVSEFDPGPLFRSVNPAQPATVEGRFNINSQFFGRALTLGELAQGAAGNFQLTSRGGTFRGLPVSVAAKLESTGGLVAGIARLGSLANAIGGKGDRTLEAIVNRAQAVGELANYWKAIPYDQLSVTLSRDAGLNTTLKDFALISPEVRLAGGGQAKHRSGTSLLDDTLEMEFTLRARGHHAELLKYLGVLEGSPDELGYLPSTLPLKVAGTLGKPDTGELNSQLAAIALEKSGVSDKAMELFNRLRGGGKP